ncbi:MAG: HlyC/CorC family transporter [Dactylosporangium sp.]|nr:hemolysin family protein [Dactylosporangium sp.]NNJ61575.1 HlyC/CorC family transporter [Dactylosporangium sp.]
MIGLLSAVALLLGNAFFVGAEFALIAARATALQPLTATSRRARAALRAMRELPLMVAGAQLGITVCSLGLGAIAEPAVAHLLVGPFAATGLPHAAVHPAAFVLALGIVVFAHTVIGEMVPKNLTLAGPEQAVMWLGPPMYAFCRATKPLLVAMRWSAKAILAFWGIETSDAIKTVFTAEELAGLVSQARTEGLLEPEEEARITGALALSRRTAREALRPWSSVTTVTSDISPAALEVLAAQVRRSRFPVIERETRRVLGFVHVKDILGITGQQRRMHIPSELIRPLPAVPPDRTLADLLLAIRRNRRHMVLVSDGLTPLGIVTLDDVLAAIVNNGSHTERIQDNAL